VNFENKITVDSKTTIKSLTIKIQKLTSSPFLKIDQKLLNLHTYICPTLVYNFQTAPLNKLKNTFLNDIDNIVRLALKEILEYPSDIPNSMIFTS
jgi:hypothetical protein